MGGLKWTVRNVDADLIRRLRVVAILRSQPLSALLNEALDIYLRRVEPQTTQRYRQGAHAET
jgi:hypothetical protein